MDAIKTERLDVFCLFSTLSRGKSTPSDLLGCARGNVSAPVSCKVPRILRLEVNSRIFTLLVLSYLIITVIPTEAVE